MDAWGWRVPLLAGCAIIPFLFRMRKSLAETGEFLARKHHASTRDVLRSLFANRKVVTLAAMLIAMSTSNFYLITVYAPTFGRTVLHLAELDSLLVTLTTGVSNFLWLPVMGAVSDRVGRRPLLFGCTILVLLTAYPALTWLTGSASFLRLLGVQLWLSFIYGSYNAGMVVYLTEIIPADVRASGFSLAQSVAAAVFGGFTPAICTYLIRLTHNPAAPGLWLSLTAAIALTATILCGRLQDRSTDCMSARI
jgi:MHS family citrate/tricarballylate:H+ symporter-like MFS transporter